MIEYFYQKSNNASFFGSNDVVNMFIETVKIFSYHVVIVAPDTSAVSEVKDVKFLIMENKSKVKTAVLTPRKVPLEIYE